MTEAKNQTWQNGFTLTVEHLSRSQMRELQLMLVLEGWHVRVSSA